MTQKRDFTYALNGAHRFVDHAPLAMVEYGGPGYGGGHGSRVIARGASGLVYTAHTDRVLGRLVAKDFRLVNPAKFAGYQSQDGLAQGIRRVAEA